MPTDSTPLAALRLRLIEQQAQIAARIAELEAQITALTRARREEFDDDEHDPEGVPLSSQWSMLAGLLESARADERRVESAQRRMAAGTFGTCEACGEPIPLPQLEARPWRERCVACSGPGSVPHRPFP